MAQIKCFNCEKEIGIQDKFCPFCSEEQKIIHNAKPHPKQKAPIKPEPELEPEQAPLSDIPSNSPKKKVKQKTVKQAKETVATTKPVKKIAKKPTKKPAETSTEELTKKPTKQVVAEAIHTPSKEQHHKQKVQKKKKKGGVGCNTILLGFVALLILGFIIKIVFLDEKTEGIKLDGPGTYGRTATGDENSKRAVKREANIKALIPNIKALKRKGELEKAYQLAKKGVQNDGTNIKLLTLLVQLAQLRDEKAGNSLNKKDNQTAKNKKQKAVKADFKQAAALLLNQLESPCDRVLALGDTDTKTEIVATCSPTKNSDFTQRYVIDTNKGEAWEE
jgi:hypothetical protein